MNSCAVKGPSEDTFVNSVKKGRELGKQVVVAGCVPQGQRAHPWLEGLSVVGVQQIDRVVEVVEETLKGQCVLVCACGVYMYRRCVHVQEVCAGTGGVYMYRWCVHVQEVCACTGGVYMYRWCVHVQEVCAYTGGVCMYRWCVHVQVVCACTGGVYMYRWCVLVCTGGMC